MTPGTEFWRDIAPIADVFKPDAMPEVYIANAATDDLRYYVPFSETVSSRPLWISPREQVGRHPALPTEAGLVNRHYHPHEVFAYTISGKWGYLEQTGSRPPATSSTRRRARATRWSPTSTPSR